MHCLGILVGASAFWQSQAHPFASLVPTDDTSPQPERRQSDSSSSNSRLSLQAPLKVPSSAPAQVDPAFLGLSIETIYWHDFAGDTASPNALSRTLIGNLINQTGTDMVLRIGGTSQDHVVLDATQKEAVKTISDKGSNMPNAPNRNSLGSPWLEAFQQIPRTKYVLGLGLASGTVNDTLAVAEGAYRAITPAKLVSIEIGNEPNLYNRHDRPESWNPRQYIAEYEQYQNAVAQRLQLGSKPMFSGGVIDQGAPDDWRAPNMIASGLQDDKSLQSFCMHHYQSGPGADLAKTLMNHEDIVNKTNGRFNSSIAYMRQHAPGVAFVIGEVGSSWGGFRPERVDGTLGAALWMVDWALHAMTIGVSRVNFHQGLEFHYAAWRPHAVNGQDPEVHAPYYGLMFVASWLGQTPLRVLSLWDQQHAHISTYAGYVNGTLARYTVINLWIWQENSGPRGSHAVVLPVPAGVKQVQVRTLTGPSANATADQMTWGGLHFSPDHPTGLAQRNASSTVQANNGQVIVTVAASEAVMVTWS